MTVGAELARLTGLRLFHNHATIELALSFFRFGEPAFVDLVKKLRCDVMEAVAQSELPGMIFTFVWALDKPEDHAVIDLYSSIFRGAGKAVFLVELEADQRTRLWRNGTPLRLEHKPSKRDRPASDANLRRLDCDHRLNSVNDFDDAEHYLKIENSNLPARDAARRIVEAFNFKTLEGA